jgi:protein SCO1/2
LTFGGPHDYHGAYLLPPLRRPAFTLTDTNRQPFPFAKATDKRVTLLFFGYTHCPDVCPATMADIAHALQQLPAPTRAAVTVVFVTTDTQRDEPAILRAWLDNFDPAFVGLTGVQTDINKLMESLRLPDPIETETTPDGYAVVHVSDVLLFTQDNIAHLVYPGGAVATDWAADLEKLVNEGFKQPQP